MEARPAAILIGLVVYLLSHLAHGAEKRLIPIRLGVSDAFSIVDSPETAKLRPAYEAALYFALGENAKELQQCGYRIEVSQQYFDTSDKFAAKERATQLENSGAWLILGPRSSDHFVISTMGVKRTPMISAAASSNAVHRLQPPFFTMYPTPQHFARAMVKGALKEGYGKSYGTLVNVTCLICKDVAQSFHQQARPQLENRFHLEVASEEPDLAQLIQALRSSPVDFLVIPNSSKLNGYVISALQHAFPDLKYVGSHSWGDGAYGLMEEFKLSRTVRALAVQPATSPEKMKDLYGIHSLDREWRGEMIGLPAASYGLIEFFRTLRKDLCRLKKKKIRLTDREAFYEHFVGLPKDHFRVKAGIGIYRLNGSTFEFAYDEPKVIHGFAD